MSLFLEDGYPLPALGADATSITMSGYSSGSYMANTMHMIYSEKVKGVAMACGGPYGFGWVGSYESPDIPDDQLEKSEQLVSHNEQAGLIDSTENLKGSPVYIMSGLNDIVIPPALQTLTKEFYGTYGANVRMESRHYGHTTLYSDPALLFQYLYQNIPGTGIDHWHPIIPGEIDDMTWLTDGVLYAFD